MTEEIIAIHGITNEEVAGKVFDEAAVRRLAEQADIVIAHSAHFDRPFVEKRFPLFNDKRWACSCDQVNWKAEGVSSKVLQYLLVFLAGRYFDGAHRALNDTEALVAVLMENLPVSGKTALKILLDEVDKGTVLFYAVDAPFAKKDTLKGRGYRWNDGSNGKPKCWWIEVPNSVEKEEEDFLAKEIYLPGRSKSLKKVALDATIRFSQRDAYAAVVGGANSSETQAALPLA